LAILAGTLVTAAVPFVVKRPLTPARAAAV